MYRLDLPREDMDLVLVNTIDSDAAVTLHTFGHVRNSTEDDWVDVVLGWQFIQRTIEYWLHLGEPELYCKEKGKKGTKRKKKDRKKRKEKKRRDKTRQDKTRKKASKPDRQTERTETRK